MYEIIYFIYDEMHIASDIRRGSYEIVISRIMDDFIIFRGLVMLANEIVCCTEKRGY